MYWGTLAERNGLDIALRAVALAQAAVPSIRLDIMGRGEQVAVLKALAAELGIAERVQFSEPVPAEHIVDFVVHGDVGIIPYRCDGFAELVLPTKAYELAWMRRPIVATDMVGVRSMFQPESLMLCAPEDPQSFADAIVALYRDPERRRRMVEAAAHEYVHYQWETMAARYVALLATLSGNGLSTPGVAAFDGERVLVTDATHDRVSLFKAADLSAIGFVPTGTPPFGACSDGTHFWITLISSGHLARF